MSKYGGFWNDSDLYDIDDDVDAIIAEQNRKHREFCEVNALIEGEEFDPENTNIPNLTEELIRYHYSFKPQNIADIIYERID